MKFTIRAALFALTVLPPILAGLWNYVPPVAYELRMRLARGMVEVSPPAELGGR